MQLLVTEIMGSSKEKAARANSITLLLLSMLGIQIVLL